MTNPADFNPINSNCQLLTVAVVAERLSVSPSLVYQMIESGKLAHHRIGTGRGTIRVSESDLESYLATCHQDLQAKPSAPVRKSRLKHIRI